MSDQLSVFVFGAGASKAAQEAQKTPQTESHRAPLVNELFQPFYQDVAADILNGEDFKRCEQECQDAIKSGGNLERWLTDRWEAIPSFGEQRTHAEKAFFGRVCFYLWRLLQRVSESYQGPNGNTYYLLMKRLIERDKPFALVTFNYDTLLDRAVKDVHGASLQSLGSYLSVPLIKPHGSVNWLIQRDSDPSSSPEAIQDDRAWIQRASGQMFNGGQFHVKDWSVIDPVHKALTEIRILRNSRRHYFYPLLFMPVTTKWYETVEGFHDKLVLRAQNEVENANSIYVIGYSASDDVFAKILDSAREGTSLYVVGVGDGVGGIADRILAKHPQLRLAKTYPVGFHRFVDEWLD